MFIGTNTAVIPQATTPPQDSCAAAAAAAASPAAKTPAQGTAGVLTASRVCEGVQPQTRAETQQLLEQRNLYGMDTSNQQGKDFERVWLLNRVVANSDRYPGFPGKSNGDYASSLRDNLLGATQARDDAFRESSPQRPPQATIDRADKQIDNARKEIDNFLNNGSSRRFYLEAADPKRM